jgi:hypothetical protein
MYFVSLATYCSVRPPENSARFNILVGNSRSPASIIPTFFPLSLHWSQSRHKEAPLLLRSLHSTHHNPFPPFFPTGSAEFRNQLFPMNLPVDKAMVKTVDSSYWQITTWNEGYFNTRISFVQKIDPFTRKIQIHDKLDSVITIVFFSYHKRNHKIKNFPLGPKQ